MITHSTGFIGSHLVGILLVRGLYHLVCSGRPSNEHARIDTIVEPQALLD